MTLLDLDTFRAEFRAEGARRSASPVARLSASEPQLVSEASRTIRFVFSDGSVDRAGDRIDPNGWDTAAFRRNPVVLWAHDSLAPPIGRSAAPFVQNGRLVGDISFAPAETYEFADTIYRLARDKYINAVSVGFLPIDYSFSDEPGREYGIDFKKQELLEISLVPVPCNANALAEARAKGLDIRPLTAWTTRKFSHADLPFSKSGKPAALQISLDEELQDAAKGIAAAARAMDEIHARQQMDRERERQDSEIAKALRRASECENDDAPHPDLVRAAIRAQLLRW